MAVDEDRMLETTHQANLFLQQTYQELEGHTEVLEIQRRSLVAQVKEERELVKQEERSNAELRNRLEQLRRQQAAAVSARRERERLTRQMQDQARHPPSGHSWARSIGVPSGHAPSELAGGGGPSAAAPAASPVQPGGGLGGGGGLLGGGSP